MKWVCSVCGYVYEGEKAPEQCPVCKAPASKFIKQEAQTKARYSLPLNSPHQSMMRFTVLNIAHASFSAAETAQFCAPMCASHMSL